MSEPIVVVCPQCSQKYRLPVSAVGCRGRCRKCNATFIVQPEGPITDDDVVAWITDSDPSSQSVMGATGVFDHVHKETGALPAGDVHGAADVKRAAAEGAAAKVRPAAGVTLAGVDPRGAHFEFPATMLAREEFRCTFPVKCVGCGAQTGLQIHLLSWPDMMTPAEAAHWRERATTALASTDEFRRDIPLIHQLPHASAVREPYTLPFPMYACEYCDPRREVHGRVTKTEHGEVCRVTIALLPVAVDFFRSSGGRDAPGYDKLVQARDHGPGPWHKLAPRVRHQLCKWYDPQGGENFQRFLPDGEGPVGELGSAGLVLTDRRVILRKHGHGHAFPLVGAARLHMATKSPCATLSISAGSQPPAAIKIDLAAAFELQNALRKLGCMWDIVA